VWLQGTLFIFSGVEFSAGQISAMQTTGTYTGYLRSETLRVVMPYLVLGGVALLMTVLIAKTKFPVLAGETTDEKVSTERPRGISKRLGPAVFAQFMYVGAQVGTWSYFITYVQDYVHLSEKAAGHLLSLTLIAFLIGRVQHILFDEVYRTEQIDAGVLRCECSAGRLRHRAA